MDFRGSALTQRLLAVSVGYDVGVGLPRKKHETMEYTPLVKALLYACNDFNRYLAPSHPHINIWRVDQGYLAENEPKFIEYLW